jgi:hypothetical protein
MNPVNPVDCGSPLSDRKDSFLWETAADVALNMIHTSTLSTKGANVPPFSILLIETQK